MESHKRAIFVVITVSVALVAGSSSTGVETFDIDAVRDKAVLDARDVRIIDEFLFEAVQELIKTKDFSSISGIRGDILSRTSSSRPKNQRQYAEKFYQSAYKHLSSGFQQAKNITPEDRRLKVLLNLLILVQGLKNTQLAELALDWVDHEKRVIQYWATRCVTSSAVIEKLNSTGTEDLKLARRIAGKLKTIVEKAGPDTLALIAEFAAKVDIRAAGQLVLQIADMRIREYIRWTVDNEILDTAILKLLYSKISSAETTNPEIARRFAQLFSCAMQKYLYRLKNDSFADETEKQQLISVLVEIETACIGKPPLNMPQRNIRQAIARGGYIAVQREHARLLGDENSPGEIPLKLNFDYGRNPDGSKRTAPLVLPPPKAKLNTTE